LTGVDALELGERVARQRRLRARPEHARVVDEQVDAVARLDHQRLAMPVVGDVAGQRDDPVQVRRRPFQRRPVAGVDDEPPAGGGERARQRQPEAARRAGDDPGGHGPDGTASLVPIAIVIGS
jgi:hypothetical protein